MVLAIGGVVYADKLINADPQITLYDTANGGGTKEANATIKLYQTFGEPAGANFQNDTGLIRITPGILGLLDDQGIAADGTYKLYISANGNNVEITWETTDNPQIFALIGNGAGEYLNDYSAAKWKLIASGGALVSPTPDGYGTFTYADNKLVHQNQVKMGTGEVYYKALWSTIPSTQYSYYIPSAEAVGKINIQLSSGFNLVGVHLVKGEGHLVSDFIANWSDQDMIFKKTSGNPTYDKAIYNGSAWSDPFSLTIPAGTGCFVKTSASKMLTLLGSVQLVGSSRIYGNGGFAIVSMAVPRAIPDGEGANLFNFASNNDTVFKKTSAANPTYDKAKAVVSGAAITWTLSPPVLDFKGGRGYFYQSNNPASVTAFSWGLNAAGLSYQSMSLAE